MLTVYAASDNTNGRPLVGLDSSFFLSFSSSFQRSFRLAARAFKADMGAAGAGDGKCRNIRSQRSATRPGRLQSAVNKYDCSRALEACNAKEVHELEYIRKLIV